jgi:WD40 repeat protein
MTPTRSRSAAGVALLAVLLSSPALAANLQQIKGDKMILGKGPFGHAHGIHAVAFSPDGKVLVTSSGQALIGKVPVFRITFWDAATGKALFQLNADDRPVHQFAFSPDGKRLYTGPRYIPAVSLVDRFVRVWDVATGRQIHQLTATRWALAPDGKTLATATPDLTDVGPPPQDGELVERFPTRYDIKLHDTALWKEVPQFRAKMGWPTAMTFSPDGRTLACGHLWDGSIELWDVVQGKQLQRLPGPGGAVLLLAFSPDSKTLAATGDGWSREWAQHSIVFWDWAAGKRLCQTVGHGNRLGGIAFTLDGKQLLSAGYDGALRRWEVATGRAAAALRERDWFAGYLALSPDGRTVALTGYLEGDPLRLRLIDLASGKEIVPQEK